PEHRGQFREPFHSRPEPANLFRRADTDVDVPEPVVVELHRQLRVLDSERVEQRRLALVRLDRRQRLAHPAEDDACALALEPDGNDAGTRLEVDLVQLERASEDEGRAERRMARERDLDNRREDAYACVPFARGGVHEHRLGEVRLPRQRLQQLLGELARVGEDRELVALERPVGEDVADDVAVATHPRNLLSGYGAAGCSYEGMIEIDTEAALLNGIGSKPLDILKNERVPGRSLKFPPPVPPPRTLPCASKITHDMEEFASASVGWMLIRSPSTEPSQAGSKRSGTRWTLSSAGWKFFADRARPPGVITTSSRWIEGVPWKPISPPRK